ncbi:hypothetical protein ABVT39_021978 [Epinephelus coioides]
MSVNSTLTSNTIHHPFFHCSDVTVNFIISVAFTVTKFLLLHPLSILVLYLGHQRWRRQRSTTMSHSDFFTVQMAAMELISQSGWVLFCCGYYADRPVMSIVGMYLCFIIFPGQTFFHILTCVERYLAVVHPVTYLGLRHSAGVRIRNISTGCVWLLCFGWIGVTALYMPEFPIIPFLSFLIFSLFVVSFCSLSVLHVLIRPGPGEVGGDREQVHQSKQRAFHTIMAIMGVLCLMFVGILVCVALDASPLLSSTDGCVVMISAIWFSLPSSLVLPLLFLHRAGKLQCGSNAD